jgi:hypothetical protein
VRGAPPWLSASAAIVGTILTAIGVFNLIDKPVPSPTPVVPQVTLTSVVVSETEVAGNGTYSGVNPDVNKILFMGRPKDAQNDPWLTAAAVLAPQAEANNIEAGEWQAARQPAVLGFRWFAVVVPASAGAVGNEDLRVNGPESEYVIAASEPFETP